MSKESLLPFFKFVLIFFAFVPVVMSAEICRPKLHGDIIIKTDSLIIERNNGTFRIGPNGNLHFDVHKVALSDEQRVSLSDYNHMIRNDLPFISHSLSQELFTSWKALDSVIAMELGKLSAFRGELNQYHQHLQNRVSTAFYDENRVLMLNHKALKIAVRELETSVPQFIATVSSRGLNDIVLLSKNTPNKLAFISMKMANLQNKLTDEVQKQRIRTRSVREEVCQRLTIWQSQEEKIQQLVPALSGWKTVTMR